MAKSIIQEDRTHCYICGRNDRADFFGLEEHHVYGGYGIREVSEKYGLKVYICGGRCHRLGEDSVHKNAEVCRMLQAKVQEIAMEHYDWTVEDFRARFRKNYI